MKHFTLLFTGLLYLNCKYLNSLTILVLISDEMCTISVTKDVKTP